MYKQTVNWLKQRPYMLLSLLGLLPLTGVLAVSHHPPAASPQPNPTLPAVSPVPPLAFMPTPSPVGSPTAKPTPAARSSPPAKSTPTQAKQAAPAHPNARPINAPPSRSAGTVSADSVVEMRVAIAEGVTSLVVGTSAGGDLLDAKGTRLQQLPAQKVYELRSDGQNLYLGSWQLPTAVVIDPDPGGVLYLGGAASAQPRAYRGRLLLVAQGSQIWAVNYIPMNYYLYSVVGSEVSPSWPIESLKAQAVAARSYALVHYLRPASPLYHLGATESYQVYTGIDHEADTTRQAVNGTAGQFVSYRGGVVESLYAASDDIVMDAFQGRGMSQLGALNLARQGYNYQQILANYYPKTGVSRIEMDNE